MDEDFLPEGWMVIDVDEDDVEESTEEPNIDESELGEQPDGLLSASEAVSPSPLVSGDGSLNLNNPETISSSDQRNAMLGVTAPLESCNIGVEESSDIGNDEPSSSKKACTILGIEVDEPGVDSDSYWSAETIEKLSTQLMSDPSSSAAASRQGSDPSSVGTPGQEDSELLPEMVTKLVADLAGDEAASADPTVTVQVKGEADRPAQCQKGSPLSTVASTSADKGHDVSGAEAVQVRSSDCSDVLAEISALCSQDDKEEPAKAVTQTTSEQSTKEITQITSEQSVEEVPQINAEQSARNDIHQPMETDSVLAPEVNEFQTKFASKSGAPGSDQMEDRKGTMKEKSTSIMEVQENPNIKPPKTLGTSSDKEENAVVANSESKSGILHPDSQSKDSANTTGTSGRQPRKKQGKPTASAASGLPKSDGAASTRKRSSLDDESGSEAKKGKQAEDARSEDRKNGDEENGQPGKQVSDGSSNRNQHESGRSKFPGKRRHGSVEAPHKADKQAKLSDESRKRTHSTGQERRTSKEKAKDSPRKRGVVRESTHTARIPSRPVRNIAEVMAQSQHLWELDMYQLAMKDLADSSISDLIGMSSMSHWTTGQSKEARKNIAKLSLMFGSTKVVKRAFRAACMFKSTPEMMSRPFLLRRECPAMKSQPPKVKEDLSQQSLTPAPSTEDVKGAPDIAAGNVLEVPKVKQEEEAEVAAKESCLETAEDSKEPSSQANRSPAVPDKAVDEETAAGNGAGDVSPGKPSDSKETSATSASVAQGPAPASSKAPTVEVTQRPGEAGNASEVGKPSDSSSTESGGTSPSRMTGSAEEQEQATHAKPAAVSLAETDSPADLEPKTSGAVSTEDAVSIAEAGNVDTESPATIQTDQAASSAEPAPQSEAMEVDDLYPDDDSYSPEEKEVNQSWRLLVHIAQPLTLKQFLESQMNDNAPFERHLSVHGIRCVKEMKGGKRKMRISIPKCYAKAVLRWAHASDTSSIKQHRDPTEMLSKISSKFSLQVTPAEAKTFVESCICSLKSVQTLADVFSPSLSMEDFTAAQQADNTFGDIIPKLLTKEEAEKSLGVEGKRSAFVTEGGVMLRAFKSGKAKTLKAVLVPVDYRDKVLAWAHVSEEGKHLSEKETTSRLVFSFHWPNVIQSIQAHLKTCEGCQKSEQKTSDKAPPAQSSTASKPATENKGAKASSGSSAGKPADPKTLASAVAGQGGGVGAKQAAAPKSGGMTTRAAASKKTASKTVDTKQSSSPAVPAAAEAKPKVDKTKVCEKFNYSPTGCFVKRCKLLHVCIQCGGQHRVEKCPLAGEGEKSKETKAVKQSAPATISSKDASQKVAGEGEKSKETKAVKQSAPATTSSKDASQKEASSARKAKASSGAGSSSTSGSGADGKADPWQRICKKFNYGPTGCFTKKCALLHVCVNCEGNHRPERCSKKVAGEGEKSKETKTAGQSAPATTRSKGASQKAESKSPGSQAAAGQSASAEKSQSANNGASTAAATGTKTAEQPTAVPKPANNSKSQTAIPKPANNSKSADRTKAASATKSAEGTGPGDSSKPADDQKPSKSADSSKSSSATSENQAAPGQMSTEEGKSPSTAREPSGAPVSKPSAETQKEAEQTALETSKSDDDSKTSGHPGTLPEGDSASPSSQPAGQPAARGEAGDATTSTKEIMKTVRANSNALVWGEDAVCDDFNTEGGCQREKCAVQHACSRCLGQHPLYQCTAEDLRCSSSFMVSLTYKQENELLAAESVPDPKIEFGPLTAEEIQPSTVIMANLPTNLRKEVQAEILQVLFPYAYGIKIAWPPKGHDGCISLLKFASSSVAQAVLRAHQSLIISGSSITLKRGVLKKGAGKQGSSGPKNRAASGTSSKPASKSEKEEQPKNISIVQGKGPQLWKKGKDTGKWKKGMEPGQRGGAPGQDQFFTPPQGAQQMYLPPPVPPYAGPHGGGMAPPPFSSASMPYRPQGVPYQRPDPNYL